MKSAGIVRKMDQLGRIVIPVEVRRTFDIQETDSLEIYVDNDRITLRKYEPTCICVFCGSSDDVISYKGKSVCSNCKTSISQAS